MDGEIIKNLQDRTVTSSGLFLHQLCQRLPVKPDTNYLFQTVQAKRRFSKVHIPS